MPARSPASAKASESEALSFEQVLESLEGVVTELERGELPLEQALAAFERGVTLSRKGASLLDDAERRIEVLLGQGEATEPLSLKEHEDE
jgi:exodeoxyribonuclease VII small subunit